MPIRTTSTTTATTWASTSRRCRHSHARPRMATYLRRCGGWLSIKHALSKAIPAGSLPVRIKIPTTSTAATFPRRSIAACTSPALTRGITHCTRAWPSTIGSPTALSPILPRTMLFRPCVPAATWLSEQARKSAGKMASIWRTSAPRPAHADHPAASCSTPAGRPRRPSGRTVSRMELDVELMSRAVVQDLGGFRRSRASERSDCRANSRRTTAPASPTWRSSISRAASRSRNPRAAILTVGPAPMGRPAVRARLYRHPARRSAERRRRGWRYWRRWRRRRWHRCPRESQALIVVARRWRDPADLAGPGTCWWWHWRRWCRGPVRSRAGPPHDPRLQLDLSAAARQPPVGLEPAADAAQRHAQSRLPRRPARESLPDGRFHGRECHRLQWAGQVRDAADQRRLRSARVPQSVRHRRVFQCAARAGEYAV